eukprot:TRINITY_DN31084_c1_g1_i1.p1 TRINITY_DN31084_c1_g1~~TRINITY_DN31084_c1_g1_i1.p1  ORF type:complete len:948 (+),score=149.67 TRINITY_DN31084_c1_g1_i1:137-2845(+)
MAITPDPFIRTGSIEPSHAGKPGRSPVELLKESPAKSCLAGDVRRPKRGISWRPALTDIAEMTETGIKIIRNHDRQVSSRSSDSSAPVVLLPCAPEAIEKEKADVVERQCAGDEAAHSQPKCASTAEVKRVAEELPSTPLGMPPTLQSSSAVAEENNATNSLDEKDTPDSKEVPLATPTSKSDDELAQVTTLHDKETFSNPSVPSDDAHHDSPFEDSGEAGDEDEDEEEDGDEDECVRYFLQETWMDKESAMKKLKLQKTLSASELINDKQGDTLESTSTVRVVKSLHRLVIHPDSSWLEVWNMFGITLFCYDAIWAPLDMLPLPEYEFRVYLNWIVRFYLSVDFVVSFFTGFRYNDSVVEKRLSVIVRRYASTWMLPDLPVLVVSWFEIADSGAVEDSSSFARAARLVRLVKVSRGLKLLRTIKLPQWLKSIVFARTEGLTIMFGMVKTILALVFVNHILACFWYSVGTAEGETLSWLDVYGFRRETVGYIYFTCLQWSFSKFAGSTPIFPSNILESMFENFAIMLAFLVQITMVSSVTTLMTQFQIVTADRSKAFATLQKYLHTKHVSKNLAMRIQSGASKAVEELARNTQEDQVELLRVVSIPLRIELHYEVYADTLKRHIFFKCFDMAYPVAMRHLCHYAIAQEGVSAGDLLFVNGAAPETPGLYFLNRGLCFYNHHDQNPIHVQPGTYFCEPCLWTVWLYHGTMKARTDCTLSLIEAKAFTKIVCQFMRREFNPVDYGRDFLKALNSLDFLEQSDLPMGSFNAKDSAHRALVGSEADEAPGTSGSGQEFSGTGKRRSVFGAGKKSFLGRESFVGPFTFQSPDSEDERSSSLFSLRPLRAGIEWIRGCLPDLFTTQTRRRNSLLAAQKLQDQDAASTPPRMLSGRSSVSSISAEIIVR